MRSKSGEFFATTLRNRCRLDSNRKNKVLLINPLVGDDYEFTRENRPLPLGLLSACSMFVDEFEVRILDQRMEDVERFIKEGGCGDYLCVGLHVMGGPQIMSGLDISRKIKAVDDIPVIWGGVFPTLRTIEILEEPAVDYVVRGEGEATFLELTKSLRDGGDPDEIEGIGFRRDAEVIINEDRPFLNMNSLPVLPYHLLDCRRYNWSAGVNVDDAFKLQIETSRGCSSQCIYCYNPSYYRKSWRAMNAEITVERFATLLREYGCNYLDLIDDSYFEDLPRVIEIAQGILRRNLRFRYLINGGKVQAILKMSAEELGLLRDSGNELIHLGAESGSDRVLETLKKGITSMEIVESNRKLQRAGIASSFYFLFGTPGETDEDRRKSLDLMLQLIRENPEAKIIAAFSFTPFVATESFEIAKRHGMSEPGSLLEYSKYDTLNTLQPWLDKQTKGEIEFIFFISIFIDGKIRDLSSSRLVRLAALLYQPMGRFRLSKMWLSFPFEMWIGKRILRLMQRRMKKRTLASRPAVVP